MQSSQTERKNNTDMRKKFTTIMSIAVLVGSMLISTLAFASEKASVSTDSKKKEVTAVQETETDESNDGFII